MYRGNGLNTVYVSDGHGLAYKYYLLQDEDGLEVDEDEEGYVCMCVCMYVYYTDTITTLHVSDGHGLIYKYDSKMRMRLKTKNKKNVCTYV